MVLDIFTNQVILQELHSVLSESKPLCLQGPDVSVDIAEIRELT